MNRKESYDYCKEYWNDIIELAAKGGPHMTPESLVEFICDVNHMIERGFWYSDACEIVLELKGYDIEEKHGFDVTGTDSAWWDQFVCFCTANPDAPQLFDKPFMLNPVDGLTYALMELA